MRRLWATKSAINGCPTSDCQTAIPVIMESFTQGHHKAICRYQYNIDRIAAKYLRMASMTNAVICLDTMKVEFEDGPEGHTLKEYQMVNRIAAIFRRDSFGNAHISSPLLSGLSRRDVDICDRINKEYQMVNRIVANIFRRDSFGNAHISSPLLSGLSRRDVDICDRINKDFERKYDSNAFDNIPFEDLSDFLPPSDFRRNRKNVKRKVRRIELSEEHRVVDYKVDNGGRLVQTVTKYDKKLIISPEKPLAGSCNQFFRMLIDADLESIRSGRVDLSFFNCMVPSVHRKQMLGSKMLTLPSPDDKMKRMLALPDASRTIKKSVRAIKAKNCDKARGADEAKLDKRFYQWQKEAESRTHSKKFDRDDFVENFEKVLCSDEC
ncbi:hypothetical protein Tcan_15704 [Toxocara canis]|uniref:Uncharacterized protein n=1 Tax=Toxocara canis TaxID=6265 RepID=A0A0B2VXP6_TOXCA|nr:hypothetical protein Tcan_15704 [Toxocara canis]